MRKLLSNTEPTKLNIRTFSKLSNAKKSTDRTHKPLSGPKLERALLHRTVRSTELFFLLHLGEAKYRIDEEPHAQPRILLN